MKSPRILGRRQQSRKGTMKQMSQIIAGSAFLIFVLVAGCQVQSKAPKTDRAAAAKDLFQRGLRNHLLSAEGKNDRTALLQAATKDYAETVKSYSDQTRWAAQAMRSLGNVRAEEQKIDDAVKLFSAVATKFPTEDWEVLQAWKSAADLLWESGRKDEAKVFYGKIVGRFRDTEDSALMKLIVQASKRRISAHATESASLR